MRINEVSKEEFESMFGKPSAESTVVEDSPFSFKPTDSMFNNSKEEILNGKKEEDKDKEKEKEENKTAEDEKTKNDSKNPDSEDSLFKEKSSEEGKNSDSEFNIKSYFTSRIKEGKFLALEDEKLETEADYDALIEANFEHKLSTIREDLDKSWYDSKSGAWKFIAKHAENYQKPQELIDLLQGVDTIEKVASLNPKEIADAEKIVRLAKRGEPEKIVDQQITALKDNNTLLIVAEEYQPLLIQEENKKIAQATFLKNKKDEADLQMVQNIHAKTVEVLEKPFLGKYKLKRDEQSAVYDLIAEPHEDEDGGGYKIFNAIDNLYEIQDFETLLEIGLLLAKKEAHRKYLGISIGDRVSETLLRKVKSSVSSNTTSTQEEPIEKQTPRLKTPSNSGESGFGFFRK